MRIPKRKKQEGIALLRGLIILYIGLTLIIASLNYGLAPRLEPEAAKTLHFVWEMFENPFKSLLILAGVVVSWRRYRHQGPGVRNNRLPILLGFVASAAVIHLILPLVLSNWEIYFVTMPLPWSSTGLQIVSGEGGFARDMLHRYGAYGSAVMATAFWVYTALILAATAIGGRRIQCSMLCMFNGFMAETMDPALPLVGSQRRATGTMRRFVTVFRWLYFGLGLGLSLIWFTAILVPGFWPEGLLMKSGNLEVIKYMSLDLMAMLVFWVFLGPRNYCAFCPAGTTCGIIGTCIAGQKIETGLSECITCGRCTAACPAGLNPMKAALAGMALSSTECLGCGRCVEICPTKNLRLSTRIQRARGRILRIGKEQV